MTEVTKTVIAPGKAVYKLPDGDYRYVDTSTYGDDWNSSFYNYPARPYQNREQRRASERRTKRKGRPRGRRRY